MAYDIGPRIGIKGEREFNDQISSINQNLKLLNSEMKSVTTSFDDNAGSQEALISKNKILNQQLDTQKQKYNLIQSQIEKQTEKLKEMNSAINKASDEFGENSVEVQKAQSAYKKQEENLTKLKIGANETKSYINKLSKEVKDNDTALQEMESGTRDAISGLKKLGDEAQSSSKDLDNTRDAAKGMSDAFAGAFAGTVVADKISDIGNSLKDVVENSKEYIKIMGALTVSSDLAGYSTEQTAETYLQLYGILGDDQTAATATANLQALKLSQDDLKLLTEGTIGAWTKYGDSIPIDGLAEAMNETVKVGKVTGTFADVLNWAGTSEDDFNNKLSKCSTESERANIILEELSKQGLTQSAEKYRETNEALVENNEEQAKWQENTAEISKKVLPVFTKMSEALNTVLDFFLQMPEPVQTFITILLGLIVVLSAIAPIILAITAASTALEISLAPIIAVIGAVVLAVAAVIAIIMNWEQVCNWFSAVWKNFTLWIKEKFNDVMNFFSTCANFFGTLFAPEIENLKKIFYGIITFFDGVFSSNWRKIWNGISDVLSGIVGSFGNIFKAPINFIIDCLNSFINGVNKIKIPSWVPMVGGKGISLPKIPRLKVGMDYVPSDFYPAFLDHGEAVLTKEENKRYRELGGIDGLEELKEMMINPDIKASAYAITGSQTIIVESNTSIDKKVIAKTITKYETKNQRNRLAFKGG